MDKEKKLAEQLREMAQVDIRSVDPADLVEIEDVKIRPELPQEERVLDYIRQIKNPYCYISHGIVVKVSFAGERKLEECLQECISMAI